MSLLLMGGWESGTNLDTFTEVSCGTGSGVVTTYRRGAQYSMCFTNNTDYALYTLPNPSNELFIQVAVIFTESSNFANYAGSLIKVIQVNDVLATLNITASGNLAVYWGDAIELVASGTLVLEQNRWYDFEMRTRQTPSSWIVQVTVDGVIDISYSGSPPTGVVVSPAAHYRFEDGALTTDSFGSNTLTAVGTPAADTGDFKEGSACVDLEYSETDYLKITDAALDAGFPLKAGVTNTFFTYFFWMKQESQATNPMYIVGKYGAVAGDRSFAVLTNINSLRVYWGYNDGGSSYEWNSTIPIVNGEWYHIGLSVSGTGKCAYMSVYRDSTGSTTSATSASFPAEVTVGDAEFRVGARAGDTSFRFDGKLDDLIVCSGYATAGLIDSVRLNSLAGLTQYSMNMTAVKVCSPTNYTIYLDDVIINDTSGTANNSWPDNVHVLALNPRSDVTSEWTTAPNVPSNWEQAQLFGASQISTSTPDAIEMYGLESCPVGITSIVAVQSLINARAHVNSPALTTFHSLLKVGVTVFESTDTVATKAYVPYFYTWEVNPATGTTWTLEDLDNLELGVKAIR